MAKDKLGHGSNSRDTMAHYRNTLDSESTRFAAYLENKSSLFHKIKKHRADAAGLSDSDLRRDEENFRKRNQ